MLIRRFVSALLTLSMLGVSVPAMASDDGGASTQQTATPPGFKASARGPLARAVETAVVEAVAQRSGRTRRSNPYGTVSYVLMGAGGLLTVYGLVHSTGVKCEEGSGLLDFNCSGTKSKGVIFSGLGAAGLGAWLFMRGERQRNVMPSISFDGRTIVANKRWSF